MPARRIEMRESTVCTSAARAMIPPSPSLSARRTSETYLTVTTRVTDQKISETTPVDVGGRRAHGVVVDREHRLDRVERAGADVAEHDAERAQRQPEQRAAGGRTVVVRLTVGGCRGGVGVRRVGGGR